MDLMCVRCLREGLKASGFDDEDVARQAVTITGGEAVCTDHLNPPADKR